VKYFIGHFELEMLSVVTILLYTSTLLRDDTLHDIIVYNSNILPAFVKLHFVGVILGVHNAMMALTART